MTEVDTERFTWLVVFGGIAAFSMAWGIGANDVANAFSTSVGAKSLTLRQATVIAAIFEFLGAFLLGSGVTDTVRKKIVDYTYYENRGDLLMLGMFSSLCAASLWLYLATRFSLPVSTTHSITGAIVGFSMAAKGSESITWETVQDIVMSWIFSPLLSLGLALVFFLTLRTTVLRSENSYKRIQLSWGFWLFLVVFIMSLFLVFKGLKRFDVGVDSIALSTAVWISVVVGIGIALPVHFLLRAPLAKFVARGPETNDSSKPVDPEDEMAQLKNKNDDEEEPVSPSVDTPNQSGWQLLKRRVSERVTRGVNVDIHDELSQFEMEMMDKSEKFDQRTERSFMWLQVCTAALDALAHGANDVANAIAPFAAMVALANDPNVESSVDVPLWILALGGVGIVIGLGTYGYNVMKAIGVRMVLMTSSRGYCIELASALTVIVATHLEMPISTTHAQTGATVGVGCLELGRKEITLRHVVNWKLLAIVFGGWVITMGVTGLTSAAIYSVLAYSPSSYGYPTD